MGIRDEVLQRLRDREPVAFVRADYRSSSEVCEGVRLYLDELEEETEEARECLEEVKLTRDREAAEVKQLRLEKDVLSSEVEALRGERKELEGAVESLRNELEQVHSGFEDYRKRGFDKVLFLKLGSLGGKTGDEVWSVLKDAEKAQRLRDEVASNLLKVDEANYEFSLIKDKSRKLEKNVASNEKKLRRVKVRLAVYREIFDVVDLAIKNGVKEKEIIELLECLSSSKSLLNLRKEIRLAEVRLAEVLRREEEAEARIAVLGSTALNEMEDVKAAGNSAIRSVASQARSEVKSLVASFGEDLAKKEALVTDIASLAEQKQQLQSLIIPAKFLLGVLESPDALRVVPAPLVFQLLESLSLWGELVFPEERVCASFNIVTGEVYATSPGSFFVKISSLVKLTMEALRQQLIKSSREQQT